MSSISPIPTTRVGDFFIRQRLANQVQADQLDLFRLQNQVSTGRRIELPSEDVPAALRAIGLQRTLQRKSQVESNLNSTQSVLGAADASLANVSQVLTDIRAEALGVVDTTSSGESRASVIQLIDEALSYLVNAGNYEYNGRYLFGGSRTDTAPFVNGGEFVEYHGNEKSLRNFVDLGQLFEANIPGTDIFGGLSGEVRSAADLDPQLTSDTLLTQVNGGAGLGSNAAIMISVNDGSVTENRVVDLSTAATIGDVIRAIESSTPAGANIGVELNDENGLTVSTDIGTVRIEEVAAGQTARELGIHTPNSASPAATVEGSDLDPAVSKTTPLTDLLGTKARGRLVATGVNNDLNLRAHENGADFNGVAVEYIPGATAGSESATYDDTTKTLTVEIQDGVSTAAQVAAAINDEGTFVAASDYHDAVSGTPPGSGAVNIQDFGPVVDGGSGQALDIESGLVLTNGEDSATLDVSTARTVEDLLNLINGADVGLAAEINTSRDGINVRSVRSGTDFTIGENGGSTATQLGIRTYTGAVRLAELNRGLGVPTNDRVDQQLDPFVDDLEIVARDGQALSVELTGVDTLQDVVDRVNNHADNNSGGTAVLAQLTADGHGIELVDSSTPVADDLIVENSLAAEYLGFLSPGEAQVVDDTPDGDGNYTLGSYRHSEEDDFRIVARDGTDLWVDATGTSTVQDVIDRINTHPRNNAGTTEVEARLAAHGNGIELIDRSSVTSNDLTVAAAGSSQAAHYLGFIAEGDEQTTSSTADGSGNFVLTSDDRHTHEVDSVFNSLIRLRQALSENDTPETSRAIERLDADLNRVNFARAEIGSRLQSLGTVQTRLEDENVQLQSALSNEIDADLVQAITDLTAGQYSLQASLKATANILNLSILDFV